MGPRLREGDGLMANSRKTVIAAQAAIYAELAGVNYFVHQQV
jgi:hypothetical protein